MLCMLRQAQGFDCRVLAYDPFPSPEVEKLGAKYVGLEELLSQVGSMNNCVG